MDFYRYKAMDAGGRIRNGQMDAHNNADLEVRLRKLGLELINYKQAKSPAQKVSGRGLGRGLSRSIQRRDLLLFCFHLEQTSRAGIPILDALKDLRDSMDKPGLRQVIAAMTESIEGGKTLSQAMQDFPAVFSTVFASLIHAGEQSGELGTVLARLGDDLKWQDEMAAQTKRLLAYPAFVGAVVIGVLFFLMTYLVPELLIFIGTMGQELPAHTRALIFVSDLFVAYWYVVLAAPGLILGGIFIGVRTSPAVRLRVDRLTIRMPLIGPIIEKIILARLASLFAMMYAAGITIIDCIKTAEAIAGNQAIAGAMQKVGREVAAGKSVSAGFAATGLFPALVLRMITVGEGSGALQESLENVAYFYTRDVRESMQRLQAMIEPTMTVVLGALIAWVMFSVLGPIYDLIATIKI